MPDTKLSQPTHKQYILKEAKFEYYLSMTVHCASAIVANYPWIFLNVFFPSIKNEQNMNLNDDESAVYLSIVTSAFFYGGIIGSLSVKLLANYNPKLVWAYSLISLGFMYLLFQFDNLVLMAISRFFQGALGRIVIISNYWWLY